jgi:predicted DCC family thiol-disulfide oxidoreductase YuxK
MNRYYRCVQAGTLKLVDISAPDFRAHDVDLSPELVKRYLHARDARGETVRGVDAFVWIWDVCGYPWLATLFRLPLIRHAARLGYRIFSRYRYRFGRRENAHVCQGDCQGRGMV